MKGVACRKVRIVTFSRRILVAAKRLRKSIAGKHYNPKLQNKITKIIKAGMVYGVDFLFSSQHEQECIDKEIFYIALFGRKTLCNLTDGGENPPLLTKDAYPERSAAISVRMMGEKHPMFGKHHSEESNRKNSESSPRVWMGKKGDEHPATGYKHTEEAKSRIIAALIGRPCSEETKQKISESNKGKPGSRLGASNSEEHNKKIGDANRGRKMSEEACRRMSDAAKKRWSPEMSKIMGERGRLAVPLIGKLHPSHKLSDDNVSEIKNSKGVISQAALAKKFGVDPSTVSRIQRGLRRKWVDGKWTDVVAVR